MNTYSFCHYQNINPDKCICSYILPNFPLQVFYYISFSLIIYKSTYFSCCLIKRALCQVFQYFQRKNSELAYQCNLICFLLLWVMLSLLFITFHSWVICILLCEIYSTPLHFIPLDFWKYLCTIHIYVMHIWENSPLKNCDIQFSPLQLLSHVRLFVTPWIAARKASLSITNSQSSLRLTSI